jgi:hypothetical protein
MLFLRELRADYDLEDVTVLADDAHYLISERRRLGIDFLMFRHGLRNNVERVFREANHWKSSFSNTFSHVDQSTADTWLQAYNVLGITPHGNTTESRQTDPFIEIRRDVIWFTSVSVRFRHAIESRIPHG